jgi:hypothetical protein
MTALLLAALLAFALDEGASPSPSVVETVPLTEEDREALASLGEGVVGPALGADKIVALGRYFPLRPGRWSFRIVDGPRRDRDHVVSLVKEGRDRWLWDGGHAFALTLDTSSPDVLDALSDVDRGHGVYSVFEPPQRILNLRARPGEVDARTVAVRVYDLERRTKEKHRGTIAITTTFVGLFEVRVPAGRFEAILTRSVYDGEIGPARVREVTYRFFGKDAGPVAFVERRQVIAFYIYRTRKRESMVLADPPEYLDD